MSLICQTDEGWERRNCWENCVLGHEKPVLCGVLKAASYDWSTECKRDVAKRSQRSKSRARALGWPECQAREFGIDSPHGAVVVRALRCPIFDGVLCPYESCYFTQHYRLSPNGDCFSETTWRNVGVSEHSFQQHIWLVFIYKLLWLQYLTQTAGSLNRSLCLPRSPINIPSTPTWDRSL